MKVQKFQLLFEFLFIASFRFAIVVSSSLQSLYVSAFHSFPVFCLRLLVRAGSLVRGDLL